MRSNFIPVAAIVIATAIMLPEQAIAQASSESLHAVAPATVSSTTSLTELVPISYSLAPASTGAVGLLPQVTSDAEAGQNQPQVRQQSDEEKRLAWTKWQAKLHATQRDAMRWEVAYQALNVIDAVQTISCVHAHKCTEANPIFGRHPSVARVLLTKGIGGALHFWLINKSSSRSPWAARLSAQLSAGIQGAVVILNLTGGLNEFR